MKVETVSYRCDVCGKATSDRGADGWVTVHAFPGYIAGITTCLKVYRHGHRLDESPNEFDLCSRECAATWLFGAP